MTAITTFGQEKFGAQIQLFLAWWYCQKQLKVNILIKNDMKKCCTYKQSSSFQHKTEHKRPICLQYFFTFAMLQ